MSRKPIEVGVGDRYGRFTVVREVDRVGIHRAFECRCDCGTLKVVQLRALRGGNTSSCGCYARERAVSRGHGGRGTLEYSTWRSMRERCRNPSHSAYGRYGGRGISVCERWMDSFEAFLEDMGPRPSAEHSIDRINNDGNYEPGNCRWATIDEQARNRSNTIRLTFRGETLLLVEWCERMGVNADMVRSRVERGWSAEDALTKPSDVKHHARDPFYKVPIKKRDANWYREYERRLSVSD